MEKNNDKSLIAVYGTLRRGCGNYEHLLKNADYMGTFKSEPTYSMYSLGGFPGVKEGGSTSIILEVFAVNAEEAKNVDNLEGYSTSTVPYFYDKKEIDTPWGNAGIYIYVKQPDEDRLIVSGDWKNRNLISV